MKSVFSLKKDCLQTLLWSNMHLIQRVKTFPVAFLFWPLQHPSPLREVDCHAVWCVTGKWKK